MKNVIGFALRYSRSVLFSFLLVLGFLGWSLKDARLELDLYESLDPSFQSSRDYWEVRESFGDTNSMIFLFENSKGWEPSQLCDLLKFWQGANQEQGLVDAVSSVFSLRHAVSEDKRIWFYKTIPDPCTSTNEEIKQALLQIKQSPMAHILPRDAERFIPIIAGMNSFSAKKVDEIKTAVGAWISNQGSDVSYVFIGPSSFRYYFDQIIKHDSRFHLLLCVFFLIFFRVFLGTWLSGFLFLTTLVATVIALFGGMTIMGLPVDLMANSLILLTAIAGVADFLFLSLYQERGSWREGVENLALPCLLTTFTTMSGFLALTISDLAVVKRFGVAAAWGAFMEWVMVFLLLPAILSAFKFEGLWIDRERAWRPKLLRWLETFKFSRGVSWVLVVIAFMGLFAFPFLNYSDSPIENFPKDHEIRKAYERFASQFDWQGRVELLFEPVTDESRVKAVLAEVEGLRDVYAIENPFVIQSEFSKQIDGSHKEMVERMLTSSPWWKQYLGPGETYRIPIFIKKLAVQSLRNLEKDVTAICGKDCRLAGQSIVYLDYSSQVGQTLLESFGISLILVILIILFLCRFSGVGQYRAVLLSILFGPLFMLGVIAALQIQVTLVTSIFLAVIVGLTGDNAIQYMLGGRAKFADSIATQARASIIFSSLLSLASLFFLFQTLAPMKILGILLFVGFLVTLAGDLFVLRGLLGHDNSSVNKNVGKIKDS